MDIRLFFKRDGGKDGKGGTSPGTGNENQRPLVQSKEVRAPPLIDSASLLFGDDSVADVLELWRFCLDLDIMKEHAPIGEDSTPALTPHRLWSESSEDGDSLLLRRLFVQLLRCILTDDTWAGTRAVPSADSVDELSFPLAVVAILRSESPAVMHNPVLDAALIEALCSELAAHDFAALPWRRRLALLMILAEVCLCSPTLRKTIDEGVAAERKQPLGRCSADARAKVHEPPQRNGRWLPFASCEGTLLFWLPSAKTLAVNLRDGRWAVAQLTPEGDRAMRLARNRGAPSSAVRPFLKAIALAESARDVFTRQQCVVRRAEDRSITGWVIKEPAEEGGAYSIAFDDGSVAEEGAEVVADLRQAREEWVCAELRARVESLLDAIPSHWLKSTRAVRGLQSDLAEAETVEDVRKQLLALPDVVADKHWKPTFRTAAWRETTSACALPATMARKLEDLREGLLWPDDVEQVQAHARCGACG